VEGTNTFVPTEEPISTVMPLVCSNASISRSNSGTPPILGSGTNAPTVGARLAALRGVLGRGGQPSSLEDRGQCIQVMERQAFPRCLLDDNLCDLHQYLIPVLEIRVR
jgi:hypothetical protein